MANVTVNITIPTFKVSAKMHQRVVAAASILAAVATGVTQFGPGFGLPAADAVYVSSAAIFVSTVLRAMFPLPDAPATAS